MQIFNGEAATVTLFHFGLHLTMSKYLQCVVMFIPNSYLFASQTTILQYHSPPEMFGYVLLCGAARELKHKLTPLNLKSAHTWEALIKTPSRERKKKRAETVSTWITNKAAWFNELKGFVCKTRSLGCKHALC